jgi:isoleucyl-tRNA synthetase
VFSTLRNTYNFFCLYANIDKVELSMLDVPYDDRAELDKWILSKYNRLIADTTKSMDEYDHMRTVRAIGEFIDEDLSNWYIRRARRRFFAEGAGEDMSIDKRAAYATTYEVLVGVARMMAPVAPFISDEIYTKLTGEQTVHTAYYPEVNEDLIDKKAEERMDLLTDQMAKSQGVNEVLKASDQMKWVGLMNNIRASAEEIVLSELIYS